MCFGETDPFLCLLGVIGFQGFFDQRRIFLWVVGQKGMCFEEFHGGCAGGDHGFSHGEVFINFQRIIALGDGVIELGVDTDIEGLYVCGKF